MTGPIDLRSDTVTLPSAAMRRAMAEAEVGDDQYGEDPSVNRLQDEVAELLGTEAALFLPSGTMANQVALRTLTRPGDDVLVPWGSHLVLHETGGGGRQRRRPVHASSAPTAPTTPMRSAPRSSRAATSSIRPRRCSSPRTPTTAPAGSSSTADALSAALAVAREHGLATYLDGARLLNAAVASGAPGRAGSRLRPHRHLAQQGPRLPGRVAAGRVAPR